MKQRADVTIPWKLLFRHWRGRTLPVLLPARVEAAEQNLLAVVAIIKNEEPYLKEWVLFHKLIGVDRFFIYDNGSTDNSLAVLKPFVEDGLVTVVPWGGFLTGFNTQRLAYAHAVSNFGGVARWMIFFDIDEFVFSETHDDLHDAFDSLPDCAALKIPRFEFGTNGHKTKPGGLVIENYTQRSSSMKTEYKSAARPDRIRETKTHHQIVHGDTVTLSAANGAPRPLRVNHYYTKSEEEFRAKIERSWPLNSNRNTDRKIAIAQEAGVDSICDEYILRLVKRLKM